MEIRADHPSVSEDRATYSRTPRFLRYLLGWSIHQASLHCGSDTLLDTTDAWAPHTGYRPMRSKSAWGKLLYSKNTSQAHSRELTKLLCRSDLTYKLQTWLRLKNMEEAIRKIIWSTFQSTLTPKWRRIFCFKRLFRFIETGKLQLTLP